MLIPEHHLSIVFIDYRDPSICGTPIYGGTLQYNIPKITPSKSTHYDIAVVSLLLITVIIHLRVPPVCLSLRIDQFELGGIALNFII